jgi:hypothetical protein
VYVENLSETVPQADVDAALPAFQLAVSRDLARVWGSDALLTTDAALEPRAAMTVRILDDSDACSLWGCALGYHELDDSGMPSAYVFAKTGADFHESWQLTFSHELFEMLVDPWLNRFALWDGRTWLVEVADPPESGYYAYFINGVAISDFITPRWYNAKLKGPFDFTRHFRHAGQIGRHGYASWWTGSGWEQVFA